MKKKILILFWLFVFGLMFIVVQIVLSGGINKFGVNEYSGDINATNAEHLDSNKNFISNIFAQIEHKDNLWSEPISNGEFVRVTYQRSLKNGNAIDVYVKGEGWFEIYDSKSNLVGISKRFNLIEEWDYIEIENLPHPTDTFYFKVKGSLQFDYIHDASTLSSATLLNPTTTITLNTNLTFFMNCSFTCTGSGALAANLYFNFNTSSTAWKRINMTSSLKNQSGTSWVVTDCDTGKNVNFGITVNATTAGTYNVRCEATTPTKAPRDVNSSSQQVIVTDPTCVYGGTGNWAINCADNCTFATTQTIANNNNVTITGTGALNFNNNGKWSFTGSNQYITIASGCTLNINTGGGWNY